MSRSKRLSVTETDLTTYTPPYADILLALAQTCKTLLFWETYVHKRGYINYGIYDADEYVIGIEHLVNIDGKMLTKFYKHIWDEGFDLMSDDEVEVLRAFLLNRYPKENPKFPLTLISTTLFI